MVTIPLGYQAYKRSYAGEPEIRLENRFLESNPTNLREKTALLSRAGTSALTTFGSGGLGAANRAQFSKIGLFSSDLFGVSGPNLWRYAADGTKTQIVGLINGDGPVSYAWTKGAGYEYLFIADGLLLQVYNGGSHATGVLNQTGAVDASYKIRVNGVYFGWNDAVNTASPDGTVSKPFLARLTGDPMENMAKLFNFDGVRGVDFSTSLGGPNSAVSATSIVNQLTLTSRSVYADGNTIATVVTAGANIAFPSATLTGGGVHALSGVPMPDGRSAKALAAVSGYVLVAIGNSQRFYWIEPGDITIDPLNFAEKESNPDNIADMNTIGDQVIISGDGSTENWYASGNTDAPFLPTEGRVYRRGAIAGTGVPVKDGLCFVGDDGIAYIIGLTGAETQYGVHRISTHAIEERIRVMLRREQGLSP